MRRVTSFVGNHGLLAVFVLMFVAAVLPAASELTMLYGGALASGALAGHIALGSHHFELGLPAYLAVVVTGVVANTARRGRSAGRSATTAAMRCSSATAAGCT